MSNVKSQMSNVQEKNVKSQMSNIKQKKQDYERRIYLYSLRLVKLLRELPNDTVSREIIKQLIHSGTSISANYIEARSASSKKDYINFFNYSLKSANETKFWLDIIFDSSIVPDNLLHEVNWLKNETQELANIIASSIITLKKSMQNK